MPERQYGSNLAIVEVVKQLRETGQPFTFDKDRVEEIKAEGRQPFLDAFYGMHSIERERIEQGVQRFTIKPDGTYGFTTTGFGR